MSQTARNYGWACTIGVASTVLLLLIAQSGTHKRILPALYFLAVLLGLATHHFFWILFLAHIIWSLLNAWNARRELPGVCKLQIAAFTLASPLLAVAVYSSALPKGTPQNFGLFLREYLQFAFLFPSEYSGSVAVPPFFLLGAFGDVVRGAALLIGLILLVVSLRSTRRPTEEILTDPEGPEPRIWFIAGLAGALAIAAFVLGAKAFIKPRPFPTLTLAAKMIGLPLVLAALGWLLQKYWRRLQASEWRPNSPAMTGGYGLVVIAAALPLIVLGVLAPVLPIYNQRGILFASPFLLLVLAAGAVPLGRRTWIGVAVAVPVLLLHLGSLVAYDRTTSDPADYRKFAFAIMPHVRSGDLIFLIKRWNVTPMIYYLPAERYRLVGQEYERACRDNPRARVWALALYTDDFSPRIKEALKAYRAVRTIQMPYVKAVLYEPDVKP
ncbi:MAG: hypothetical protein HYR60_04495 [Acidobacteria bacterium]|nr:hypothetical protein [Acidobacteriota bacterium]